MSVQIENTAPVVEAKAISRRFGAMQAIDRVDLRIDRGEIVGYVGPNGSGKTTTMRAMLGLLRLDSGQLRIFGHDVQSEFAHIGPHLGAVFDQHALHPELTVRETLDLYARLYETPGRRRRVDEVIEIMGLGDRAASKAKTLSKGLQQRLAFGRAIVHSPELMLLDEPFDGIDTETHRHLRELLRRLARESGTSMFLTSHDLHEVDQIATRVVILDRGRVVASGSPAELKRGVGGGGVFVAFQEPVTSEQIHVALADAATPDDIVVAAGGLEATIHLSLPVDVVAGRLLAAGLRVRQFHPLDSTLEDAYFAHLEEVR